MIGIGPNGEQVPFHARTPPQHVRPSNHSGTFIPPPFIATIATIHLIAVRRRDARARQQIPILHSNASLSPTPLLLSRACIFCLDVLRDLLFHRPELYPTEIRSTGHAVSNAFARLGAVGASYWVASSMSNEVVAVLLGVVGVIGGLAAQVRSPVLCIGSIPSPPERLRSPEPVDIWYRSTYATIFPFLQ